MDDDDNNTAAEKKNHLLLRQPLCRLPPQAPPTPAHLLCLAQSLPTYVTFATQLGM